MSILTTIRRHRMARKMKCADVCLVLQQYLDGELHGDTTPLVEAHLDVCRRCGLDAAIYTDLKDALANRAEPPQESLLRLREFGERIAHGDVPMDGTE